MRMTQTIEENSVEIAIKLIQKGDYSDQEIAELVDLPPERVTQLRAEITSK